MTRSQFHHQVVNQLWYAREKSRICIPSSPDFGILPGHHPNLAQKEQAGLYILAQGVPNLVNTTEIHRSHHFDRSKKGLVNVLMGCTSPKYWVYNGVFRLQQILESDVQNP